MPWTPEQVQRRKAENRAIAEASRDTAAAVDNFTSSVETLLIALSQRDLSPEQIDRLAAILQRGERDLLRRISTSSVVRGRQAAPAPRSTGSRKAEAA